MNKRICMYAYMYIHICICITCVYIHIYVYIYVYVYTNVLHCTMGVSIISSNIIYTHAYAHGSERTSMLIKS